ncbi:hypothetical protein [Cyclobacterium sp.]|uniref:hypothetical protein n=1 Tax=Cyclobacterium sp. TaxID=1966343 RepID=UPI00198B1E02|nr:hypothetical protein [Cyclobacterium sp.]MBD3630631.1 hypothetical protein [Cyclobacterium sp.]
MLQKSQTNFITKLLHWEYWPTWIIYFPLFFYYLWLSLKARSFFFFTAANPEMEMGGLYNCSKYKQLQHIPSELKPLTLYVKAGSEFPLIHAKILALELDYPIIAKPDRGERGKGVALLKNASQLKKYLQESPTDFLLQEYISSPFEAGLFYYRFPDKHSGLIPSIVLKTFLSVTGDGKSTLEELILRIPRARLVAKSLLQRGDMDPREILPEGSIKLLEPIGNHNRGTEFSNGNQLVNQDLLYFFDALSYHLPHFHYGRFDLKAPSLDDFLKGNGIKILEVNGVNAEPAHIYDPKGKYQDAVKTLFRHWNIIYQISKKNRYQGFSPATFRMALKNFREWQRH